MIDALWFSHSRRRGGRSKPIIEKCSLSCVYRLKSQCFCFQRLKASFAHFMPGLRARFVWKQNDTTLHPAPY